MIFLYYNINFIPQFLLTLFFNFYIIFIDMKATKKISFNIAIAASFCIVYTIFAIKPLGTEYQFTPEWKIDVTNPSLSKPLEGEPLLPFKLGQTLGYFTPEGKVTTFVTFPQKASISRNYYTCYGNNNRETEYFNADGTSAGKIKVTGFPMIDDSHIFTFLPGGSSIVSCGHDGKRHWEYGGAVPITAFDSSENAIVLGFADGNICEFSHDGTLLQRFTPGGSDNPVILGAAVSKNGAYIATVSGQNRQRFVLAKKEGAQTKITAHEFLNSKEPFQKLVKFSADDSTVYYATENELGIADVETGKKSHLKINGNALSIQESGKTVFLLSKKGSVYTVYIIEKFATLIGSFSFQADSAFILTDGKKLYIGKDSTISCVSISKK